MHIDLAYLSTFLLLGAVIIVSIKGFNDRDFMEKYLFSPYSVSMSNEWYRFFTHAFLHGDTMHLFFNCFAIYSFGMYLESWFHFRYGIQLGEVIYWVFIIAAMFSSSLISYYRHKDNIHYRSIGISGVTSAMIFGYILIDPTGTLSLMFIPVPIPAWLFGLIYLGFEIYADRNKRTNIAHDAHIAGAIFGILFIFLTNIEYVIQQFNSLLQ